MKLLKGNIDLKLNSVYYTHVPKTAGMSIRKSLENSNIKIVNKNSHHILQETKHFKITSIRNPYDRLVSSYHYMSQRKTKITSYLRKNYKTFEKFIFGLREDPILYNCDHFKLQTHWIKNDLNNYDFVIRFENIQRDWYNLCSMLNIDGKLIHKNKSRHNEYSLLYTNELYKEANIYLQDEFEILGYDPVI